MTAKEIHELLLDRKSKGIQFVFVEIKDQNIVTQLKQMGYDVHPKFPTVFLVT